MPRVTRYKSIVSKWIYQSELCYGELAVIFIHIRFNINDLTIDITKQLFNEITTDRTYVERTYC